MEFVILKKYFFKVGIFFKLYFDVDFEKHLFIQRSTGIHKINSTAYYKFVKIKLSPDLDI